MAKTNAGFTVVVLMLLFFVVVNDADSIYATK